MRTSLFATFLLVVTHARQIAQEQLRGLATPDQRAPRANTAGGTTTTNELSLRLAGPNLTYMAEFGIGSPPQRFELGIVSTTLSVLPLHDGS
ncbi:hypothetical protein PG991_000785 [Apiospora marii]|uniref:Uncharacterized protein n=1 Tax=Apiospora marii TaxID=335849 RepID=A0ABR1SSZ1_9PEZI